MVEIMVAVAVRAVPVAVHPHQIMAGPEVVA